MKRSFLPALAAVFMACALIAPARAEIKFMPLFDATLSVTSGNYDAEYAAARVDDDGNTLASNQNSTSSQAYLSLAPNLHFTEIPGLWITPLVEFDYTGANNLLNIEDEAFVFEQQRSWYYLIGANYQATKSWSFKLKGFGRTQNVKDVNDESLDNGLYNYNDLGAWGEAAVLYRLGLPMRSRLGYKGYSRRYPQYTNEAFLENYQATTGQDLDIPILHDKDVNVGEFWLRQEMTWNFAPVLTNLELRVQDVSYTEQLVIDGIGSFTEDLRKDEYVQFGLELPWMINRHHQIEFDYTYTYRGSNQGWFDTGETIFMDYYDYLQGSARLLYTFRTGFKITGFPHQGSVGFSYQSRTYPGRASRQKTDDSDTLGVYNFDEPHQENTLDFSVTLRQTLFVKWFNLFLTFHGISQSSNTTVEDNATYNFKYNTFSLGTAVSF